MTKKIVTIFIIIMLSLNGLSAYSATKGDKQLSSTDIKKLQKQLIQLKNESDTKKTMLSSLENQHKLLSDQNKEIINQTAEAEKQGEEKKAQVIVDHVIQITKKSIIKDIYLNGNKVVNLKKTGDYIDDTWEIHSIIPDMPIDFYIAITDLTDMFNVNMTWDEKNRILYFNDR